MTPKEVVQKGYDCFTSGDMETFVGLFHDDCVITMNGMHKFSGTYHGINEFMGVLAQIPSHFDNFSVKVTNMGHFHKLQDGKIKEFWIYDDSQKMARVMKAV